MKKYLLFFLFNTPLVFASSYEDCIDLTAHEKFSLPNGYVEFEAINWKEALPVCEQAVIDYPEDFKVLYGLSRVYARQFDETGDKELAEKEVYYMVKSYWAGFSHSGWVLALHYLENKEWDQGIYWLDQSIKDGNELAINKKALLLFDDSEEYPYKNYQEAIALLKTASEGDNKNIHYNLAVLHFLDKYENVDYELVLKHSIKAADLGSVSSLYILGQIYYDGYGTEKDYKKAVEYFLAAKKSGLKSNELNFYLSQSALKAWEQSEDFEYFDVFINTLRSMALNDHQEAKRVLRQHQIVISPENTSLDYVTVISQGAVHLRKVNVYSKAYSENKNDENKEKVISELDKFAQIMIKNGYYDKAISVFEDIVSQGYSPFVTTSKRHLAKMYVLLFADYEQRSDAVQALASALITGSDGLFEEVSSVVHERVDEETYDSYLASAEQIFKDYKINYVINLFEDALKLQVEIPSLALEIYLQYSDLNIDAQRSQDGLSMLHLAILHNNTELARRLIRDGADINLEDHYGDKPLGYAEHMKNKELITYLRRLGAQL
ncbi:ankyrin repeat domain-containing protein [Marinomonas dokdonensis]|uniref:ankyrin repeat domain-containing protein n=1 Tax=Marinomonas dokdonensis TaxID=328224 RepID=UPI0040553C6F